MKTGVASIRRAIWQGRFFAPLLLFYPANALAITPLFPSFCNDGQVDAAIKAGDVAKFRQLVIENYEVGPEGYGVGKKVKNILDHSWSDLIKKSRLDHVLFSGNMKIFLFSEDKYTATESIYSENKAKKYNVISRTGLMFRCDSRKISEFEWLNFGVTTRNICEQKALND